MRLIEALLALTLIILGLACWTAFLSRQGIEMKKFVELTLMTEKHDNSKITVDLNLIEAFTDTLPFNKVESTQINMASGVKFFVKEKYIEVLNLLKGDL